jgi:predicted nucleic acid-binding protein
MIGRLDILNGLFSAVSIPEAVHKEIVEGGKNNLGLAHYRKAHWIKAINVTNPIDPLLKTTLDQGEAEVIELARQIDANFVLIDERKARKIARNIYGLRVIGPARILVEAKKHKLIDNVKDAIQNMRTGGYFIAGSIVAEILKQAGEQQVGTD